MTDKQHPTLKVIFLWNWAGGHYDSELISHLKTRGVDVEIHNSTMFFLTDVLKRKPVILHIHQQLQSFLLGKDLIRQLMKAFIFASQVKLLRLLGIRTIWTAHEWAHKFGGEITPLQSAIIGNSFHAIIAHCETTQRQLESAFMLENKNKVFNIPHGNYLDIENTISKQDARSKLNLPEDSFVFLLFGHLYPFKGHLEAIEAFQKLDQDRSYMLIVGSVGDVQFKEQIEKKIAGYQNILLIPERIPDERIQIYMNACDCVILPYKVFTTSGVALMAMSFKRACIAPNKDFFADTLGEYGGFLYNPTQEGGLLQAMNSALKNTDRLAEMGHRNFNQVKEWDWSTIAEKTFQVYIK